MNISGETYEVEIGNPFPGLRAFNASESHLFFGREEHIEDVLNKLEQNHFVAVVGTSGTGKSSLIRAGVLPAISNQNNSNSEVNWQVISMNPGSSPFLNLADAICNYSSLIDESARASFKEKLIQLTESSSLGLVQAMRTKLTGPDRLLILVDQFEEVFRFASEDDKKPVYDAFVKMLIETVQQSDVPIYVILTLRSDFLGDCVQFEGLPEAINDGHYLVPRMNAVQIRRAITGPIDLAKGKISPRLVQHVNQHLGNNADQLPILQHAMMRTWNEWKNSEVAGEPMDLKHFEAIGGLSRALSSHANEAYSELNQDQRDLCEKIFKCLTTKQADNRGVRRPMSLQSLTTITQSSNEQVLACLRPFRESERNFILPGLDTEADQNTVFDISHESLMRGWDLLTQWVDEEMESAEFYQRLCNTALLHKRGESALWRNPELQLGIDWRKKQIPSKEWAALYDDNFELALGFLSQSKEADTLERSKKKRRNAIIRVAVTVFILIISALATWAMFQTGVANEKSKEAEQKSIEALEQKSLAEKAKEKALEASNQALIAKGVAEEQADRADAQKVIADKEKQRAEIAAQSARREQRLALEQKLIADQKSEEAIFQKLKADSARNEALRLRMISIGQNLAYESGQVIQNPELAALLAISAYDIAIGYGGEANDATLYSSSNKAMEEIIPNYSTVVLKPENPLLAMQCNNQYLSCIDQNGNLTKYSSTDYKELTSIKNPIKSELINTSYISPSSEYVAFGMEDNTLVTNAMGQAFPTNTGHEGLIRSVCFIESTNTLISGGRDNKLIVWNKGGLKDSLRLDARVRSISTLANNMLVYAGCEDGRVHAFNYATNKASLFNVRENVRVEVVEQSSDGKIIAIGYSDGITRVMNNSGQVLRDLPGTGIVSNLVLDKSANVLVTASTSKALSIYNLDNLTSLPIIINFERQVKHLSIQPGSFDLYVYTSDRAVRRYPTQIKNIIDVLNTRVNRELSKEEWNTFIGKDVPYKSLKNKELKSSLR